eukprot:4402774-Pyramimonas_sp.AAC.1
MGIYPLFLRLIGPLWEYTHSHCVRLVRYGNIPTLPASDWSVVRIYPLQGRTQQEAGRENMDSSPHGRLFTASVKNSPC